MIIYSCKVLIKQILLFTNFTLLQTEHRNRIHNRFCQPWIQTVCQLKMPCIWSIQSRTRASVSLYKINPANKTIKISYRTRIEFDIYLGINSDCLSTLIAVVGEHVLVALDAVGMIISQNVTVASKGIVTMVAKHFSLFRTKIIKSTNILQE